MPRKPRPTLSGAPGQAAVAPKGQTYGEGERALESQRRMPVPDFAQQPQAALPSGAPAGGGGRAEALQAALAAAQGLDLGGSAIATPTQRPGEPVTQPLSALSGSGAGKRPMPNPAIYELRAVAQMFPYPGLLDFLAQVEREA